MFNNSTLNIIISLLFIFLLYSLLATALHEALANIFQGRANTLYKGIKQMLTNKDLKQSTFSRIKNYIICRFTDLWNWLKSWVSDKEVKSLYNKFYDHPIIKNYGENAVFSKPSYLNPENFSGILIDTLKNLDKEKELVTADFPMIRDIVNRYSQNKPGEKNATNTDAPTQTDNKVPEADRVIDYETFKILNYHLNEAAGDLHVFQHRLEKWFNDSMDRVSGWYKRHTQFMLLLIGLSLAISLNIDTIAITGYLSKHKQQAELLANMGEAAIKDPSLHPTTDPVTQKALQDIVKQSDSVSNILGLGWGDYGNNKCFWDKVGYVLKQSFTVSWSRFLGFLITAIAISLGAPFWFDLLSKFVNLRSTGKAIKSNGSAPQNNTSGNDQIDG
ncbi:MAG: hypothetical protein QM737_02475 [Ferruginibacter sp.]